MKSPQFSQDPIKSTKENNSSYTSRAAKAKGEKKEVVEWDDDLLEKICPTAYKTSKSSSGFVID